jgi:hypothetical protein
VKRQLPSCSVSPKPRAAYIALTQNRGQLAARIQRVDNNRLSSITGRYAQQARLPEQVR